MNPLCNLYSITTNQEAIIRLFRFGFAAPALRASCNFAAARLRQLFGFVVFPLKRTLDRPLGKLILRYGSTGNEENFIYADPPPASGDHLDESFTPTRDGELYVYLNKPALGAVSPNFP